MAYDLALTQSRCPAQADEDIRDTAVGEVLRTAARRWPDALSLQAANADGTLGRAWTYAQLLTAIERLAVALLTRYDAGERIAVWAPNVPNWIICEFAFGLAGLTLVTVNPGINREN